MSSEWMKVMLEEIARKKTESEQAFAEERRRRDEQGRGDEQARGDEQGRGDERPLRNEQDDSGL